MCVSAMLVTLCCSSPPRSSADRRIFIFLFPPEKDLLVNQMAELQRVCEALLLSQMQVRAVDTGLPVSKTCRLA